MKLAIANLVPPFMDGKVSEAAKPSGPKPFSKDFLLLLEKGAKGEDGASGLSQTESNADRNLESYIEKLRRTLLARGKSPSRSSLKGEDVLLLKDFLCGCGLAQGEVNAFMNQLLQQSEGGEIRLFRFLEEASKLTSQSQNSSKARLEASAIPIVESLLREKGLDPRAAERLIERSRTADGALDLEQLARRLEKQADLRGKTAEGPVAETAKNSLLGDRAAAQGLGKQRPGEGEAIPKRVESSINQILEKAVVPEEKQATVPSFSPPLLQGASLFKPLDQRIQETRAIPKKDASQVDPLSPESPGRSKHSQDSSSGRSTSMKQNHPLDWEDQEPIPEPLSRGRKERASGVQPESKVFGFQHQSLETAAPELSINPAQRAQTQAIPPYLLEQVTRQISRSMPEGERVVKLLLKPPELGYLTLQIDMKDNTLRLGMRTETRSALELLISGASELKETLLAQGIKIEKMDIQIEDQLRQSFSFSQGAQGEEFMEKSHQSQRALEVASLGEGGDDPSGMERIAAGNDHLIDVTA
jgi:flagellar hook-length control protein FliK